LTGMVRNFWPKRRLDRTLWLDETLKFSQPGNDSTVFVGDQVVDPLLSVQYGEVVPQAPDSDDD